MQILESASLSGTIRHVNRLFSNCPTSRLRPTNSGGRRGGGAGSDKTGLLINHSELPTSDPFLTALPQPDLTPWHVTDSIGMSFMSSFLPTRPSSCSQNNSQCVTGPRKNVCWMDTRTDARFYRSCPEHASALRNGFPPGNLTA